MSPRPAAAGAHRARWLWLLAGFLIAVATASAATARTPSSAPALARDGERLVLVDLPDVLDATEVARALRSGLTTTFTFRLERSSGSDEALGGAWVEVRWEPWDEVYFFVFRGPDGAARRQTAAADQLAAVWSSLRLPIAGGGAGLRAAAAERGARPLRLRLDVTPFSTSEQRDTQRWLAESLSGPLSGSPESRTESTEADAEDRGDALAEAFQVLLATSLERRVVYSEQWRIGRPPPVVGERRSP